MSALFVSPEVASRPSGIGAVPAAARAASLVEDAWRVVREGHAAHGGVVSGYAGCERCRPLRVLAASLAGPVDPLGGDPVAHVAQALLVEGEYLTLAWAAKVAGKLKVTLSLAQYQAVRELLEAVHLGGRGRPEAAVAATVLGDPCLERHRGLLDAHEAVRAQPVGPGTASGRDPGPEAGRSVLAAASVALGGTERLAALLFAGLRTTASVEEERGWVAANLAQNRTSYGLTRRPSGKRLFEASNADVFSSEEDIALLDAFQRLRKASRQGIVNIFGKTVLRLVLSQMWPELYAPDEKPAMDEETVAETAAPAAVTAPAFSGYEVAAVHARHLADKCAAGAGRAVEPRLLRPRAQWLALRAGRGTLSRAEEETLSAASDAAHDVLLASTGWGVEGESEPERRGRWCLRTAFPGIGKGLSQESKCRCCTRIYDFVAERPAWCRVFVEIDGAQHFEYVEKFRTDLAVQRQRDAAKGWCFWNQERARPGATPGLFLAIDEALVGSDRAAAELAAVLPDIVSWALSTGKWWVVVRLAGARHAGRVRAWPGVAQPEATSFGRYVLHSLDQAPVAGSGELGDGPDTAPMAA